MSQRPFMAIFPKTPQFYDEVVIKGKIQDAAKLFSVNFCLDSSPSPELVAYHFKTIFKDNSVVQNYKTGSWHDEVVAENKWIEGPGYSFVLTFLFTDINITVYTEDENRNFQYSFKHKFDVGQIKSVQVWDDVEYISEISFRFKNPR